MRTSSIFRSLPLLALILTLGEASDPRLLKRIIYGEDATSIDSRLRAIPGDDDQAATAMEPEDSGEHEIMPISLGAPVADSADSIVESASHMSEAVPSMKSEYLRYTEDDGTEFPRSFVMSYGERGTVTYLIGSRGIFGYGPRTLSKFTVLTADKTVDVGPVTTVQKVAADATNRVVSVAGVTTTVSVDGVTETWNIEPQTSVFSVDGTGVTLTVPESTAFYTMWGDTFSLKLPGAQTVASVPGVSTTVIIPGASTVVSVPGKVSTVVVPGTSTTVPDGRSEDVTLVRQGTTEVVAVSTEVSHVLQVPEGAVTLDRPMTAVVLYASATITTYWVSGPDTTVALSETKAMEAAPTSDTMKVESSGVSLETSSKKSTTVASSVAPSSTMKETSKVESKETTSEVRTEAPKMTTIYSARVYSTTETFVTELFGMTTTIIRPTVVTEDVAVRTEEVSSKTEEKQPVSTMVPIEVQTKNGAAAVAVPLEALLAFAAFLL